MSLDNIKCNSILFNYKNYVYSLLESLSGDNGAKIIYTFLNMPCDHSSSLSPDRRNLSSCIKSLVQWVLVKIFSRETADTQYTHVAQLLSIVVDLVVFHYNEEEGLSAQDKKESYTLLVEVKELVSTDCVAQCEGLSEHIDVLKRQLSTLMENDTYFIQQHVHEKCKTEHDDYTKLLVSLCEGKTVLECDTQHLDTNMLGCEDWLKDIRQLALTQPQCVYDNAATLIAKFLKYAYREYLQCKGKANQSVQKIQKYIDSLFDVKSLNNKRIIYYLILTLQAYLCSLLEKESTQEAMIKTLAKTYLDILSRLVCESNVIHPNTSKKEIKRMRIFNYVLLTVFLKHLTYSFNPNSLIHEKSDIDRYSMFGILPEISKVVSIKSVKAYSVVLSDAVNVDEWLKIIHDFLAFDYDNISQSKENYNYNSLKSQLVFSVIDSTTEPLLKKLFSGNEIWESLFIHSVSLQQSWSLPIKNVVEAHGMNRYLYKLLCHYIYDQKNLSFAKIIIRQLDQPKNKLFIINNISVFYLNMRAFWNFFDRYVLRIKCSLNEKATYSTYFLNQFSLLHNHVLDWLKNSGEKTSQRLCLSAEKHMRSVIKMFIKTTAGVSTSYQHVMRLSLGIMSENMGHIKQALASREGRSFCTIFARPEKAGSSQARVGGSVQKKRKNTFGSTKGVKKTRATNRRKKPLWQDLHALYCANRSTSLTVDAEGMKDCVYLFKSIAEPSQSDNLETLELITRLVERFKNSSQSIDTICHFIEFQTFLLQTSGAKKLHIDYEHLTLKMMNFVRTLLENYDLDAGSERVRAVMESLFILISAYGEYLKQNVSPGALSKSIECLVGSVRHIELCYLKRIETYLLNLSKISQRLNKDKQRVVLSDDATLSVDKSIFEEKTSYDDDPVLQKLIRHNALLLRLHDEFLQWFVKYAETSGGAISCSSLDLVQKDESEGITSLDGRSLLVVLLIKTLLSKHGMREALFAAIIGCQHGVNDLKKLLQSMDGLYGIEFNQVILFVCVETVTFYLNQLIGLCHEIDEKLDASSLLPALFISAVKSLSNLFGLCFQQTSGSSKDSLELASQRSAPFVLNVLRRSVNNISRNATITCFVKHYNNECVKQFLLLRECALMIDWLDQPGVEYRSAVINLLKIQSPGQMLCMHHLKAILTMLPTYLPLSKRTQVVIERLVKSMLSLVPGQQISQDITRFRQAVLVSQPNTSCSLVETGEEAPTPTVLN